MNNSEPLSNLEALQILRNREKHSDISQKFLEYLEKIVPVENEYKMEKLRKIKDHISIEKLCNVANIQDISFLTEQERKKLESKIKKLE